MSIELNTVDGYDPACGGTSLQPLRLFYMYNCKLQIHDSIELNA